MAGTKAGAARARDRRAALAARRRAAYEAIDGDNMTATDAARAIGVDPRTIKRWRADRRAQPC